MVSGMESFREWFRGYDESYAVIGDAACALLMEDRGLDFRTVREMDVVLTGDTRDGSFGERFREYAASALYECQKDSTDEFLLCRLIKPISGEFPAGIKLFSAGSSDGGYSCMLKEGRRQVSGITILDAPYLIPFKAKAWMDLSDRRSAGEQVKSREIRKHKNDLFRLTVLLGAGQEFSLHVPPAVSSDMREFIKRMETEHVDLKRLGIWGRTRDEILEELRGLYCS